MTAAFPSLKPLIIPDSQDLIIGAQPSDALLHLLTDINARLNIIAAYQEPVIPDPPDTTGRMIAGTPFVMNPYSTSTTTTAQAHGLGAVPVYFKVELECLTAENGYSVGDVINGRFINFDIIFDATNIQLVTGVIATSMFGKSTQATSGFTASRWKLTVTPYGLTTS